MVLVVASALLASVLALKHAGWLPADLAALLIAGATGAATATAAVLVQGRRRRTHEKKVADELDAFAGRLLRLETQIATLDGAGSRADTTLTDMEGDVHSLSQAVRSLAETVSSQESDIRDLKLRSTAGLTFQAAAERERPAPAPPSAWSSTPSFLPARDRFEPPRIEPGPAAPPAALVPSPVEEAAIRAAAIRGDLDFHLAPLLALPQRAERAYGLYPMLELPAGQILGPSEYIPVLERSGEAGASSGVALGEALTLLRRLALLGKGAPLLVEVGDGALRDPAFGARIGALPLDILTGGASLVLQVTQRAFDGAETGQAALARLRDAGATFALSDIRDINLNPVALARRGVRYVLLPADALLDEAQAANLSALVSALTEAGIAAVATGVDDEAVVPELIELGLPLAQGLGLALPYPADALLERIAREPAGLDPPVRAGSALEGPLRDFLRRAI